MFTKAAAEAMGGEDMVLAYLIELDGAPGFVEID